MVNATDHQLFRITPVFSWNPQDKWWGGGNDELERWWENVLICQNKDNQPTENESTDESQNTEKIKHTSKS